MKINKAKIDKSLPDLIIRWYRKNKRDLPWRENIDPYRVWLSEVMLQQTRVTTVIPYYYRFLAAFPALSSLAAADEERLFKLWEGLGYYSRARNLRKTADIIIREYGGAFPSSYEQILSLPGIGPYTAGAIASICFGEPVPAIDGNVLRVLTRIGAISGDISQASVKKQIREALMQIYPQANSGDFNQGLIELGATVCVPNGKPGCERCPVNEICKAYKNNTINQFPQKRPPQKRKQKKMTVLVLQCNQNFAICKRDEKGLLAGLWAFPNCAGWLNVAQARKLAETWGAKPTAVIKNADKTHVFTHIEWKMRFRLILCDEQPPEFKWVSMAELNEMYAMPTAFQLPDGFI
jgi:A/G-specific adenine glycosylase